MSTENNNAQEIATLAVAAIGPHVASTGAAPFVALPCGYSLRSVEGTLAKPSRNRGIVSVARPADFVRLVTDAGSSAYEIFSNATAEIYVAVLNWDTWRDHRITLSIQKSVHFRLFEEALNKVRTQRDFIRFLEDFCPYITQPDAAAILEVASKFRAVQNVKFTSVQEVANGNCNIEFIKTNEAGTSDASGRLQKIPEEFVVEMPIFEGEPNSALTIRLGYDIADGKLVFGLSIHLLHLELRRLADARSKAISAELNGKPIAVGDALVIEPLKTS